MGAEAPRNIRATDQHQKTSVRLFSPTANWESGDPRRPAYGKACTVKSYSPIAIATICFVAAGCSDEQKKGWVETTGTACVPTIAYYEIEGSSVDEIRKQLDLHGPTDSTGISHDALTLWGIRWNWPDYGSPSEDVSRAKVTCKAMIILPKLKNIEDLPKDLPEKWTGYVSELMQHEMEHVEIARECRNAIEKAIRESHSNEAERTATAILGEYKDKEVLMDQKTEHGQKTGVRFPWTQA